MSQNDEEKQRERLELLKMKQGIISESELIPKEPEKQPTPPMTIGQKISNFFYYYKFPLLFGVAAVIVLVFLITQTFSRETPDIEVLLIGTESNSPLTSRSTQVELALEKYCPDINGDGNIHVSVISIDLGLEETAGQYYLSQMQLFDRELTGDACIIISDSGFQSYMTDEVGASVEVFRNLSEQSENSPQYSIALADTAIGAVMAEFPENAYVYFLIAGRDEAVVKQSEVVVNAILPQ